MKRRKFIQLSTLATLPVLLKSCDWLTEEAQFPIQVLTDIHTGHLIFESQSFPKSEVISTECLVVGGGIAGLAAASQLKNRDFLLCELSENLGGTSSFYQHEQTVFAQGAHYDLAYPSNYGEETLQFLESLDIVKYQGWKDMWSFRDRQYIIPTRRESQCFIDGKFREEVLPASKLRDDFQQLMQEFLGEMKMPTRLIDKKFSDLNQQSFFSWLSGKLSLNEEFIRGLDYHMLDDWGGTASQVSALAGVHYFSCRPYYSKVVDLFSPPNGNGYFIQKMADRLPMGQLLTGHLVRQIQADKDGFLVDVIDIANRQVKVIRSNKLVYAGQKHALKYIMPSQYPLFESNLYAPWLVVNFVTKLDTSPTLFWQNEMIVEDRTFLGFVDSGMQYVENQGKRVLTAYYCLPPESREDLRNVEENKEAIVQKTLGYLQQYFGKDISLQVEAAYLKVMGHAMAIPQPGFLMDDKNDQRIHSNMTFAGVDNGRLPLLFEAMDSGIMAASSL